MPSEPYPEEGTEEYIYPTPQAYAPEYSYSEYQPETSTETSMEIAEQVAEEKIQKLKKE